MAAHFFPSLLRPRMAPANLDRRLAALRVLEALRSYAADHQGQLPKQLSEMDGLPVPGDPVTGRPLDYRLDGETAVLVLSAVGNVPAREYRLKIAR